MSVSISFRIASLQLKLRKAQGYRVTAADPDQSRQMRDWSLTEFYNLIPGVMDDLVALDAAGVLEDMKGMALAEVPA